MTVDGERPSPQEEDKAKMLFGNRHAVRILLIINITILLYEPNIIDASIFVHFHVSLQPENKSTRKGVFKFPTKQ